MLSDNLNSGEIVGEAGAGLVKVVYSRLGVPVRVEIDDLIFKKEDKQLISDLFVAATKQALEKFAQMLAESRRNTLYNSFGDTSGLPKGKSE